MVKLNQVYRCPICGNIVVVTHAGGGELVCCGQPMELLEEKTQDKGQEKHVPVIEETKDGIRVKVGSVPHPMEKNHFIEWIEVITQKEGIFRQYLKLGQAPEATFPLKKEDVAMVREYCNQHGLWKTT